MPTPRFSNDVLATAVAVKRGQKRLTDVPEKTRPAVQDALGRDSVLSTYLRSRPAIGSGPTGTKPHFRFVS